MALHLSDIRADIERGDTNGIRDAFRAVANFPKEDAIVGAEADTLPILLGELCDAVRGDRGQMPGDFAEELRSRLNQDETALIKSGTYSEAGKAVRLNIETFTAYFDCAERG